VFIGGLKERQSGVVAAAAEAGALEVGLGANHELIELEVVAGLSAAHDAALVANRIAVGQEEQVGTDGRVGVRANLVSRIIVSRIARSAAIGVPAAADVHTEVEPGPHWRGGGGGT